MHEVELVLKPEKREGRPQDVPGDDLTNDSDGLVAGVSQLGVIDLDDLSVVLVSPSTVVPEAGSGFGDIESSREGEGLSVVWERGGGSERLARWGEVLVVYSAKEKLTQRLDGSDLVGVGFDGLSESHQEFSSSVPRNFLSPDGVVSFLGGVTDREKKRLSAN